MFPIISLLNNLIHWIYKKGMFFEIVFRVFSRLKINENEAASSIP